MDHSLQIFSSEALLPHYLLIKKEIAEAIGVDLTDPYPSQNFYEWYVAHQLDRSLRGYGIESTVLKEHIRIDSFLTVFEVPTFYHFHVLTENLIGDLLLPHLPYLNYCRDIRAMVAGTTIVLAYQSIHYRPREGGTHPHVF